MRNYGKQVVAALILLLGVPVALAGTLDTVSVSVENRTPEEQQRALGEALNQVLVRLSGKPSVLELPVAGEAAEQLNRWVIRQDFRDGQLVARFDTGGLMQLLSSRRAPVWGVPRPRVLVWLVDQGTGKGSMVNPGHPDFAMLKQEADRRGLDVVLPEWDSVDRGALAVADIRGRFDNQILDASARYPHEMVLAAVLYSGSPATVSWRVLQGRKTLDDGRLKADSTEQAIADLVDSVTNQLADRFAVAGGASDQRTLLTVETVGSLGDWKSLRDFLAGLGGVQSVSLVQVSGDSLIYGLDFAGSDAQLRDLLSLSSSLTPCPDETVAGPQWRYCWRR
ncbi:MAG: DUF2066 domain-containing protein [Alcanivorax sediminis]|uniref:DUF2066 domain-containing protein n=1 Tax=Alcanivorax sediminis TaxID=2663008 RepID=A0A6N7M033_9GAMM|nr:DUF2066 domain-containing protein [Alcanivorax sediminis]MQX53680.1 DUF2066 domain-containing protein [Alcanivorax sediminis]